MAKIHELLGIEPNKPFWIKKGVNSFKKMTLNDIGFPYREETETEQEYFDNKICDYEDIIRTLNGNYEILIEPPITITKAEFSLLKYLGIDAVQPILNQEFFLRLISMPAAYKDGKKVLECGPVDIGTMRADRFPSLEHINKTVYINDLNII